MKYTLIFFLFLTLGLPAASQNLGLPFSKFYSSEEYQGGIQNFSIAQSEKGLIYVANNFGLLEYDGTSWRKYSLPNSTKVRDVVIDDSGRILTSGQADFGYFASDKKGSLEFFSLIDKLPSELRNINEVWKIFKAHDRIYFCTVDYIFIFNNAFEYVGNIKSYSSFESYHLAGNQIYINEWEKGLHIISKDSLLPLASGNDLAGKMLSGVISLSQDQRLVFTRDEGIYLHTVSGLKKWRYQLEGGSKINKAFRLKEGSIAVGTQNDGMYLINELEGVTQHLHKGNGIQNNTILSFFEDIGGNLWMGHNNGITLLELNLPFRKIDQYSGLEGTGYDAHLLQGRLYYGTNDGVYSQNLNTPSRNVSPLSQTEGQVYWISDYQGDLLVGHNDGAIVYDGDRLDKTQETSGIWNFQPLKNHPNLVLSGGYNGLFLFENQNGKLRFKRKLQGFNESSRIVEQDEDGTIWMAHGYKGVYKLLLDDKLENVTVQHYGKDQGLPSNLLNSVWKINNRILFTTEIGVYSYNQSSDSFEKDGMFSAYFDEGTIITSMAEDPLGNIFYIASQEVGVLEKQINGGYLKNHQVFNKIKPLLNDDLQNLALIQSNEVLFAAKEGFIWYRLDQSKPVTPAYPTLIRSIYLTNPSDSLIYSGNYNSSNNDESISYPYENGNIRFEFSNPVPNQENSTQFQVWLEGLESEYGEWSNRRDRAYTNLREGDYVFHVRSKNLYGELGEEARFAFTILPPWYRSTWAYIIYGLMVISGIYSSYQWIEKRNKLKTAKITSAQRQALKQKEMALQDSQAEIERLQTEKLENQIQSKNKELASATMHLINKNGFINHVKTGVTSVIKKTKNQEVKHELEKVVQSIEKNIAADADWEQFEIHFDQVHGDFLYRFKKRYDNLSPQEIKLSAYLRMNLSSKEIANLMNISTRGIEIARYRLRKKLQLERSENLQEFILKF
ncbi:regulator [Litoribacter alkaliphilus]|uniref:Regulator n=1 Tax=Litoribacter ruber TaxID=702568 RepID=A0AAP2CHX8_9BACT|nr:triple tyrosine motif-containing protein [Litoribacter alkaliphilus]MBS9524492.1 regulator [Litoribacter alkaliphilus]